MFEYVFSILLALFSYDPLRLSPAQPHRAALLGAQARHQRWEADAEGVNLYHYADEGRGFFVEVGVDYGQD